MRTLFTLAAATLAPFDAHIAKCRGPNDRLPGHDLRNYRTRSEQFVRIRVRGNAGGAVLALLTLRRFSPRSVRSPSTTAPRAGTTGGTKQSLPLGTSLCPLATRPRLRTAATTTPRPSASIRATIAASPLRRQPTPYFATGSWRQHPLACFSPADTGTDGPVLDYFQGGASLWATRDGTISKHNRAKLLYGQPGAQLALPTPRSPCRTRTSPPGRRPSA